ncbi:hypothetical protein ABZ40_13440 [Listeria monocytogenes]|nr:hypothetical protein [Listeria monocytogenes]
MLDNNNTIYNKSALFASMKNNASRKSEFNDIKQESKSIGEKKKDKKKVKHFQLLISTKLANVVWFRK